MKEITVDAIVESIKKVTDFINEELENYDCSMKAQMQISVAIDELISNISYYAYESKVGEVTVQLEVIDDYAIITFIDNGIPYNPLEKTDPDITLSADEREIGGLGIFLVKKNMDDIFYENKEGKNILQIKKSLK